MEARGRIKIRPGEVTLALLAALAYGVAVAVFVPPVWPLMPFPQVPPVRVIAALSFSFGLVLRRRSRRITSTSRRRPGAWIATRWPRPWS